MQDKLEMIEDKSQQEKQTYPDKFIPTMKNIEELKLVANTTKTTGHDFIPYQIIKTERGRKILLTSITRLLRDNLST